LLFKVTGRGAEGRLGPQFKRCSPSTCSFAPSFARFPRILFTLSDQESKISLVLSPCAMLLTLALT
jgi:hypothetical protein